MDNLIKKVVKYNYYKVKKIDIKANKELENDKFDISEWLLKYKEIIKNEDCIEGLDYKCKIENNIEFLKEGRFVVGKLYKLRPEQNLKKIKPKEKTDIIHLEEDEYLGEDMMFLYDFKNNIIMLQNNRFSMSLKKIEKLFNVDPNKKCIRFEPIKNEINLNKIVKGKVKNLKIRVNDLGEIENCGKSSLCKMIRENKEKKVNTIYIELGTGRVKSSEIDKEIVSEYLEDLETIKKNISLARVVFYDENDQRNILDIFDANLYETIEYEINPRDDINFDEAKNKMSTSMIARFGE